MTAVDDFFFASLWYTRARPNSDDSDETAPLPSLLAHTK